MTVPVLHGLLTVVDGGGFKAQVEELEKNAVFKKIYEKHGEKYYSQWQKVLDRAEEQKQRAGTELNRMTEVGGQGGIGNYIVYGEQRQNILLPGNGPRERNERNVRLAQVLTAKMLSDPMLSTLHQAVGAGMIRTADVASEVLAYVERKNIRMLDQRGRLDREFRRKLENGDFQKELVKSQSKFVTQAKNRDAAEKKNLQSRINAARKPAAGPLL